MGVYYNANTIYFAKNWWSTKDYLAQEEIARKHRATKTLMCRNGVWFRDYCPHTIVQLYHLEEGM